MYLKRREGDVAAITRKRMGGGQGDRTGSGVVKEDEVGG